VGVRVMSSADVEELRNDIEGVCSGCNVRTSVEVNVISGLPRSFSPMFGRSRNDGVQY
jgi:hypothetical protein